MGAGKFGRTGSVRPVPPGAGTARAAGTTKSVNKCHTAARKYFLLALFQIPTTTEDDADGAPNAPAPRASSGPSKRDDAKAANAWTTRFLAGVRQCPTASDLDRYVRENEQRLERVAVVAPERRAAADNAIARRRSELTASPRTLPPLIGARAQRVPERHGPA